MRIPKTLTPMWRPSQLVTIVALALSHSTGAGAQTGPSNTFRAKQLVIASDGDMQAQAYAGERLGPPALDTLSVVAFDGNGQPRLAGSTAVPNSVIGPPASLAITPDGRYAIVVETRGPRPEGRSDARLADLPPGHEISVVDLSDPAHPVVVQRLAGRAAPLSVSISPDGRLVAIAYDTSKAEGAPLDLYDLDGGELSGKRSPAPPGFRDGDALKNAAFAPDGALALVYATQPRLSLVRVVRTATSTALTRWGNDVPLGRTPFEVRFTPDDRFALVNDMTVPAEGTDVRGTLICIALDVARIADGSPVHRVVSEARTGVLPEGLAISPDARWIATTNLERSIYPADDPRQGFFASVTLLHLDPQGALVRVGDYPFAGVIPEAAAFDDASRFLAVAVFDHLPPQVSQGSVDVWRITGDFQDPTRVELVPTGTSIAIARGAQSMEIVR